MKKLIVGMLAALLLGTGLIGFTSGSAVAACPYTGCVDTTTNVKGPTTIRHGKKPTYVVKVKTDGNATPKGTIKLIIQGPGFYYSATKTLSGGSASISGPKLKKGTYTVTIKFIPKPGSAFARSSESFTLHVK